MRLREGFCRSSKNRPGLHPPNDDRWGNHLDGALLQQQDEVAQFAEALRIMKRMHAVPAFEVRDPLAVEHLGRPKHAFEPFVVEPMSRDGFVVRRLHHRGTGAVPNQGDPSLVRVVSARSKHQERRANVVADQGSLGCVRVPHHAELQGNHALSHALSLPGEPNRMLDAAPVRPRIPGT